MLQAKPRKLMTVNWRDMKKTFFDADFVEGSRMPPVDVSDSAGVASASSLELENDNLRKLPWIDDDLQERDLVGVAHHQFDLAEQFDLDRYIDILADEAIDASTSKTQDSRSSTRSNVREDMASYRKKDASTVLPSASEWEAW